jgi:hypothetical protein
MISPIFYIISLRSPKTRPRLVILDAQSDPNYEVVIPDTGGCGCAKRSEVSEDCRTGPKKSYVRLSHASLVVVEFLLEPNLLPTVVGLYVGCLSYLTPLLCPSLRGLKTPPVEGKAGILLTPRTAKRSTSFSSAHVL